MLNKKVISNIMSLLILQGANYILPLITLPYLVITLGIEKFGILAFALAIIRYFTILIDYGFNLSATREISIHIKDKELISKIFTSVIVIKTILLIISFIILWLSIQWFDKLNQYQDVYYLTFLMLIGNVLFPVWYFQGIEKMKYITIINILSKTIFTIFIFVFIQTEDDYVYVPLINSIGIILGGLVAFIIAIKNIKFTVPSCHYLQKTLYNSTSLFISNVSITLFTSSNVFILGIFTSDSTVGLYSSIERLMMAVKNLYVPLYQGIFPWLAKKNSEDTRLFIKKILPYITLLSLSSTILIAIFAEKILTLIYHNDIISSYAYILQIFSLISVLSAVNMLYNYLYLNAIKAYSERMKIFIIAGFFNLVLGLALVYFYNILGITLTVVMTEFLLLYLGFNIFEKLNFKARI